MQATYVMCANKKALPYLPKGADINSLTWGQFAQWATNLQKKFGTPEVGFPVAGLFPRFLEGYLIPSFTGALVTKFESTKARPRLALPEEPLALRQPAVDAVRLHAGSAALGGGARRLGPRRPADERPAGEA